MPRRKTLTDEQVRALPRGDTRRTVPDVESRGLYIRVPARGASTPITYVAVARNPRGAQIWRTLGAHPDMTIAAARAAAVAAIAEIKNGATAPKPPIGDDTVATVAAVCANWLRRVVDAKQYRTGAENATYH